MTADFTPTGKLRAAINLGNPILAYRGKDGGARGVSVDLAGEFARRLGVDLELVVVDAAGKSVDVVAAEQADIGFFAIDPARGEGLRFTAPYVLIEGSYLVPAASALQDNAEVDRAGTRVGVGAGSAYDLFLTRELKNAAIERLPNAGAVRQAIRTGGIEVAAGIRQLLEGWARDEASLRMLPGHFMVIQQAMGLPAGRGAEAAAFLAAFIEDMKASGFVGGALARHRIEGASVAPAAAA